MSDMAAALDAAERVQKEALDEAGERVSDAIAALSPFQFNEGRVLPGVERAVKDVREKLTTTLNDLAAIVSLHFTKVKDEAPNPAIESEVNHAHLEVVRQAKDEEAA